MVGFPACKCLIDFFFWPAYDTSRAVAGIVVLQMFSLVYLFIPFFDNAAFFFRRTGQPRCARGAGCLLGAGSIIHDVVVDLFFFSLIF